MDIFKRMTSNTQEKRQVAVVVISDTHINSTNAICPRTMNLDDGGTYRASRNQMMLNNFFDDFIKVVANITADYDVVLVLNGDIGELDSKKRSSQVITRNNSTVLKMMFETLEPLIDLADRLLVVRGTGAHTGKSAWLEEMFAYDLESIIIAEDKENSIFSHWHARKSFGGVRFDIAHHGRMGGMRHTQKNYANKLAQETTDLYRDRWAELPDVAIRSHNHRRADSGHNWPVFGLFTPSWQLQTEFVYRIGQENSFPSVGGDIFLCNSGPLDNEIYDGYQAAHDNFTWIPISYKPEVEREIWETVSLKDN